MLLAAAIILAFILFCVWQNGYITVKSYEYKGSLVPPGLDGLTIAQVSDLHNRRIKGGPQRLVDIVRAQSPDVIAITGDLIDRHRTDIERAMEFIRAVITVAPVYFVSGNHEHRSGQYSTLLPLLKQAGVRVLEDTVEVVERNGQRITLAGLTDPAFFNNQSGKADEKVLAERKKRLCQLKLPADPSSLFVLLSHRPELFSLYAECGAHLVLTGHAHGGQVRLPGVGGLYAPGQGVFPGYTSGMHRRGDTAMVVSRGLGGKFTRLRVFNRPEVVVVKLVHDPSLSS